MKLLLRCTQGIGLIPLYDEDYDEKKKLKWGEDYEADIKVARDITKHRQFFSLLNNSWKYLNEKQTAFFKENLDCYRKTVLLAAGHCDTIYNLKLKQWEQHVKSISFDKVDDLEFNDLYERCKNVIFDTFLTDITYEEYSSKFKTY